MVVLRAELFQQRERCGKRLDALHGSVGHVRGRPAFTSDQRDVGALRDEVLNHLDIAPGGGMMERGVALVIEGVHVGVHLLDEIFDRRQHTRRRIAVMVRRKTFAVALAGRRQERGDRGRTHGNGRHAGHVLSLARRVACAHAARRPNRPDVRIGAPLHEQLHGVDVRGVGGAPEGRRPGFVDARLVEVVLRVPDFLGQPGVGIRPLPQ